MGSVRLFEAVIGKPLSHPTACSSILNLLLEAAFQSVKLLLTPFASSCRKQMQSFAPSLCAGHSNATPPPPPCQGNLSVEVPEVKEGALCPKLWVRDSLMASTFVFPWSDQGLHSAG